MGGIKMITKAMTISEFMNGDYKKSSKKKNIAKMAKRVGTSIAVPLVLAKPAFAAEAIPASTTQVLGEKSLEIIAHALDPVVQLLVAISFPIASIIIVGACFFFMFGMNDRGWSTIMNCGLGYVLIQLSPLLLNILKQVGNAV
jgi:hypothetical protein